MLQLKRKKLRTTNEILSNDAYDYTINIDDFMYDDLRGLNKDINVEYNILDIQSIATEE